MAHLTRGNGEFRDYRQLFSRAPLRWSPGSPRPEASLTDVFPRDEFYMNNAVRLTHDLMRPGDLMAEHMPR
jgi:hypothetical protein